MKHADAEFRSHGLSARQDAGRSGPCSEAQRILQGGLEARAPHPEIGRHESWKTSRERKVVLKLGCRVIGGHSTR